MAAEAQPTGASQSMVVMVAEGYMNHLIRRDNSEDDGALLLQKLFDEAVDLSDHGAVLALSRRSHDTRQINQSQIRGTRRLDLQGPG